MRKQNIILGLTVLILFAANGFTETIFETFDTDPTLGAWSSSGSSTVWTYEPTSRREGGTSGFLNADIYRDNADPANYSVPITPIDKTTEFWMEMDIVHYEAGYYQNANFGVHNSSAADHETDMISGRHNYGEYATGFRGNRMDLYGYSSDGTQHYDLSPYIHSPLVEGAEYGAPQRIKIHYWYESATDEGYAALQAYHINDDGTLGDLLYESDPPLNDLIETGDVFSANAFGLFNKTSGGYTSIYHNLNEYDNLYYSTEGWNMDPVAPDFIPEPSSLILLSFGGLGLLSRRRNLR